MGETVSGFEAAFKLVGGHGRFQWLCMALCAWQLVMMTWNHMGYIFIGAVPQHWCHIAALDDSGWTVEQVKNISIPKIYSMTNDATEPGTEQEFTYDSCNLYKLDYKLLLELSGGNFDVAYRIVHGNHNELHQQLVHGSSSSFGKSPDEITAAVNDGLTSFGKGACEQGWSYDKSIYTSTIVTEFDLVCGRRYLVASVQASYMIGAFTGTLIFGPLNDKILGRRRTVLVSIVMVLIGGFLASMSTSYIMFIAMRYLVAMGTGGCMQGTSVWFLEHCDTKSRARLYCISSIFFGVGYAIMPIYAYFIREWWTLQLAFSLTTLTLLSFYWLFPESARWLASKGRTEEAVKALERIAKINRMPKPSRHQLLKAVRECQIPDAEEELSKSIVLSDSAPDACEEDAMGRKQLGRNNGDADDDDDENGIGLDKAVNGPNLRSRQKKTSILRKIIGAINNFRSLCGTKELRRISFTVWTLFICVAFVYYMLAFSTNLTSNPYLLVSLGAFMEVPASVLPIPFLSRWGRRPTTISCFALTGISALAISAVPANLESARTIFSMAGKLFVASAFTVLYLVVSEVYPTVVRTTGQAAGTLMGRVGSIAAPYAADLLTTVYPNLPMLIIGIVALLASGVAFFLPEMKGLDMKDQVCQVQSQDRPTMTKSRTNSN